MNAVVFLLLPTALGVDFGWERQPDNSIEYIVQIEPEAVDQMKTGTELLSTLPPSVRNTIRNYRIRVGRDRLPNQNTLPPEATALNGTTQPSYLPGGATSSTYPLNSASPNLGTNTAAYPNNTGTYNNTGGFVNSSLPGNRPTTTYPTAQLPSTNQPYAAPTNTTAYPNNSTYPNNTTYPAGTGYNTTTSQPYGQPQNPSANYGQPNYTQPNYNQPNYSQPSYAQPNYTQPNYTQPNYTQPNYAQTGYPQYVAANPNAPGANTNPGPYLGDPQAYGMAKPSIEMPSPTGTAGYGPTSYANAQNPATYPQGQPQQPGQSLSPNTQYAGAANDPRFVNTALDPKPAGDTANKAVAAAAEPQSQWVSLTFALIALFASLGANFYLGWTTFHLRERYRMMLAERTTY